MTVGRTDYGFTEIRRCSNLNNRVLESTKRIDEETTNMALGLSFVPHCGNKYFMSAADGGVKIYDFEKEVVQFYSSSEIVIS